MQTDWKGPKLLPCSLIGGHSWGQATAHLAWDCVGSCGRPGSGGPGRPPWSSAGRCGCSPGSNAPCSLARGTGASCSPCRNWMGRIPAAVGRNMSLENRTEPCMSETNGSSPLVTASFDIFDDGLQDHFAAVPSCEALPRKDVHATTASMRVQCEPSPVLPVLAIPLGRDGGVGDLLTMLHTMSDGTTSIHSAPGSSW